MNKKAVLPALLIATLLLTNVSTLAMSTANASLAISSIGYATAKPNDGVSQTMGMIGMYWAIAGAAAMIACGPVGVAILL